MLRNHQGVAQNGNERIPWVLSATKLVSDSNEFSLKLVWFLNLMEQSQQMWEAGVGKRELVQYHRA
jgi:hypothetical protein